MNTEWLKDQTKHLDLLFGLSKYYSLGITILVPIGMILDFYGYLDYGLKEEFTLEIMRSTGDYVEFTFKMLLAVAFAITLPLSLITYIIFKIHKSFNKRKKWAWYFAILLFIFETSSFTFPLTIYAMYLVVKKSTRDEFFATLPHESE